MSLATAQKALDSKILRVSLLALAVMVGLIVAAVLNLLEVRRYNAEITAAVGRQQQLAEIRTRLVEAETSQRAYLLTGDPVFEEEFLLFSSEIEILLRARTNQSTTSGPVADYQAFADSIQLRLGALREVVQQYKSEGNDIVQALTESHHGKVLMDAYRERYRVVAQAELDFLGDLRQQRETESSQLLYMLCSGAAVSLALLALGLVSARKEVRVRRLLLDELGKSSAEMTQLNELNSSLLSCLEHDEAARLIRHYLQQLFPGTAGGLYLYRASRNVLELQGDWGDPVGELPERLLNEECWALRRGRVHVRAQRTDLSCAHSVADTASCCVPMMALGDTLGVLYLQFTSAAADPLPPEQQRLLETTASQIAGAVANLNLRAALHAQSIKDPLTGLYNRRYLEETMQREELRAHREGLPFSIVMVDVDHFKAFNDDHGHQAGNLLLQAFGQELHRQVRGEDIACRYGGEEFMLILPGMDTALALARANQVRLHVSQLQISFAGRPLPQITASFGVATYPQHGEQWQQVMRRADAALYQAKREGRNRCVAAEETIQASI